jgi:hypothetical protein
MRSLLKLKPINVGIDRSLTPLRFRNALEFG